MDPAGQLSRSLTLTHSTALVVGKVIGTGVFLKAAVMTQQTQSSKVMLMAWAAAGLLSLAGALTYAELSAMYPEAGGEYVYLRAAYGRMAAFLCGWMQLVVAQSGVIAALSVGGATFLSALIPINAVWVTRTIHLLGRDVNFQIGARQIVAVALIVVFSCVNCAGVALGGRIQTALTAAKVLGVIAIIGGVFFFSHQATWRNLGNGSGTEWVGLRAFGAAMFAALFAYNGWNNLPMAAGEVRDPGKTIPRALIGGMLAVLGLYLLINLAYVYALPLDEVIASNSTAYPAALPVATRASETFLGASGSKFVSIVFVVSTIGTLNAGILAAARIPFAMARDGLFPSGLRALGARSHAPVRAIAIQAVWASVLALSGSFDQLTDFAIFPLWLFFALTASAVFVLRRKAPEAERPYRAFGYPVLPALFILVACWLVVNTLMTNPVGSGAGLVMIALGLPLYFYFRHRGSSSRN